MSPTEPRSWRAPLILSFAIVHERPGRDVEPDRSPGDPRYNERHARPVRWRPAGYATLAVGSVLDKHKMGKHFELIVTDTSLVYRRTDDTIAAEARLDGIYVIRTNVPKEALSPEETVGAYKALAQSFRTTE